MTLVQRVQTDPLQAGASQIARLSTESGYLVPAIFGGPGIGHDQDAQAFQGFHGLREIVTTTNSGEANQPTNICLSVYPETEITDPTSTSFSGQFFSACAAGRFPATVQFDLRTQGLSASLRQELAPWNALQFVYDTKHDEVVVFASR